MSSRLLEAASKFNGYTAKAGACELPKEDFVESLKPRRPRLAVVNGERV